MLKVKKNVTIFQCLINIFLKHEKIGLVIIMLYGKKLKVLRERIGDSQSKIGSLINLDSGTYCNYEQEKLIMPTKHLNTLCNYFNVSFDYIFNFSEIINYQNSKKEISKTLISSRLKELRKKNNLTQNKLAQLLNVSRTTITEYERGRNLIATPFLYTICKKYNISADYLLGRTDEPKYLK